MKAWAAAAVLAAGPALAQVPPPLQVEIGEVGVVQQSDPNAPVTPPSGGNLVGTSPQNPTRFTHLGDDVDARFCTSFGFRFRTPNLPPPLSLHVTIVLDHPVWNRPDGRTGTQERYENTLDSTWSYSGYALEENWTLVPGTWKFTVMLGDMVLATQSFELTVKPGQTFPDGGCSVPVS